MRSLTYAEAINEAMHIAMQRDDKVLCYGLGVDDPKCIFGTTKDLQNRFGELSLKLLRENIHTLNEKERTIIKHLEKIKNLQDENPISLKKSNGVSSFDQEYFMKHWISLNSDSNVPESLFYICLYFYRLLNQ